MDIYLTTPVLSKDSEKQAYTFVLKAGQDIIVESRWSLIPAYGQIFIIDSKDIIELKQHSKQFSKTTKVKARALRRCTIKGGQ